jgi:phosphoglycolate phosphatase
MSYETIIFDFDGTLVDSLETFRLIFNELAEKNKIKTILQEDLEELKDNDIHDFLKKYKISKARFLFYVIRGKKMMKEKLNEIPLIEGFNSVLPELKNKHKMVGILSSNSKENIEIYLENHHLKQYFDFISNTNKLLNKAKFLKAISRTFSLDKSKILYVGDEIRDLQAAKKFGVDFAGVPWGFNSKDRLLKLKPQHMLKHPRDLLDLIQL